MPSVRLSTTNGVTVSAAPTAYLDTSWGRYMDAMRSVGARFDKALKCQVIRLHQVEATIRALRDGGFEVEVDEGVASQLDGLRKVSEAERETAKGLHDAAIERMKVIDARLAERGLALYPYQKDGVRWLSHRRGAGLFDEMGLGKTVQALISAPEGAPILVVCPAAVKGVWVKETRTWRPDLGWPMPLSGRNSFRWPKPGDIVITNYDVLPEAENISENPDHPRYALPEWVGPAAKGTVCIYDECHALKNPQAKRTRAARLLSQRVRETNGFCWGLTGTPLLNRPNELWHVLNVLEVAKEAYGTKQKFRALFTERWVQQPDGSVKIRVAPRPEVADKLRKVSLMRRRLEVLPDLPSKTYQTIEVHIDDDTRALADEMQAALEEAGVKLENIQDIADLVSATKYAKLDIGLISRVRAALAKAKIPRLLELAEQYEDEETPLVVFSAHRAPVDSLAQREGWDKITGEIVGMERMAITTRFAAGQAKGIACTIRAAGVGIDGLQRASHNVVFCDLDWTPGWNQQAEDRVCRIGQDTGVVVTTLVADHMLDVKVMELLGYKARIIEHAVNASARETVEEQFPDGPVADIMPGVKVTTAVEIASKAGPSQIPVPRLWEAFQRAKASGLAFPTIMLENFQLKVAGRHSTYAGCVMITNGQPYGSEDNQWYGYIDRGEFYPKRRCTQAIADTIRRWEDNPDELRKDAAAYGHKTGACCFCWQDLTDERSVTVGYGPICAERWGLPWGDADNQVVNIPLQTILPKENEG